MAVFMEVVYIAAKNEAQMCRAGIAGKLASDERFEVVVEKEN